MIIATVNGTLSVMDNNVLLEYPHSDATKSLLHEIMISNDPDSADELWDAYENMPLDYGLADDLKQVMDHPRCQVFFRDTDRKYILNHRLVTPETEPGLRPHKQGEYIGNYGEEVATNEYLTRELIVFSFVQMA